MKYTTLIFLFNIELNASNFTELNASSLTSEWKFEEMIYQGQRMERSDPALNLRWTFFANGTDRLYWDRGTTEFCERFAHFKYSENQLQTNIFWVNPLNSVDCSADPDMKLKGQSKTRLEVNGFELLLYLAVSDEPLIYVLRKVSSNK